MSSYTYSQSQTFTETHAKHLAAKVSSDLKRMQRFYGSPIDSWISDFEEEVVQLLKKGFLGEVIYGFQRENKWIEPTLRYTAKELANSSIDEDPGKVRPGADISNASFYSFLTYSDAYVRASQDEKERTKANLPFERGISDKPGANGYFTNDRTYYSGAKGLDRASLKGF